jgi:hypothetical protein
MQASVVILSDLIAIGSRRWLARVDDTRDDDAGRGRSVHSYEPSRVQADDDGTWIVQFTADEQFGEGLALLRAAAWLAHHREHTLRELSFSWAADEDSGDLDASVQLVVIANMNNPHYPALHRFALPAGRLVNAVMSKASPNPRREGLERNLRGRFRRPHAPLSGRTWRGQGAGVRALGTTMRCSR